MTQKLRALAALLEVLSSIPSNHMVAHSIYNEIWHAGIHLGNVVYIINKSLKTNKQTNRTECHSPGCRRHLGLINFTKYSVPVEEDPRV